MADVIGRAVIHVDADANESSFDRAGKDAADDFGSQFGKALKAHNERVKNDFGDRINKTIAATGTKAGDGFAANFNKTISKNITGASIGKRLADDIEKNSLSGRLKTSFNRFFSQTGDEAGNSFTRRFNATIGDGVSKASVGISKILQGGIVSNPPSAVALMGGLVAAAPGIGSTIGAGLTAGIGASIAGIGIAFAAQADEVKKRWKRLGGDLNTLFQSLAKPLESTLISVADDIEVMFDKLAPSFRRAFSKMAPVLEDFSEQITDSLADAGPGIEKFADAFNKQLEGLAKSGGLKDTAEALESLAESLEGDELANFVDGLDDVLAKMVEVIEALEEINDATGELEEGNVGKGFKDLFEVGGLGKEVRREIQILKDDLAGVGDAPLAKWVRAWNKADEAVANAMENAGEAIGKFVTSIPGRIGDVGNKIGNVFSRGWDRVTRNTGNATDRITTRVRRFASRLGEVLSNGWNRITNATSRAWNRVTNAIGNAMDRARRAVSRGVGNVRDAIARGWERVTNATSRAWNRVTNAIGNAMDRARRAVSRGVGNVRDAIARGWDNVVSATSRAWDRAVNAVQRGVGRVVDVVDGLPGKVKSAIGSLGRVLFDAGASLVQGLIDGINSKLDDVTSAASKVASKVKGLFPGSPIKEGPLLSWNNGGAGKELMELLAQGIEIGGAKPVAAANNVAAGVARTTTPNALGTPVGAASTPGGGSSQVVVNQNYYGPTTGSERLRETEWTLRYAINNGRAVPA